MGRIARPRGSGAYRGSAAVARCPGGRFRYHHETATGQKVTFSGEYLEVRPVTRLVYTFHTEEYPGSEVKASVDLREVDGVTHLTIVLSERKPGPLGRGMASGVVSVRRVVSRYMA
ncbi:MAG: SRPBCC family protein [Thermoplasmatota archaeon]